MEILTGYTLGEEPWGASIRLEWAGADGSDEGSARLAIQSKEIGPVTDKLRDVLASYDPIEINRLIESLGGQRLR